MPVAWRKTNKTESNGINAVGMEASRAILPLSSLRGSLFVAVARNVHCYRKLALPNMSSLLDDADQCAQEAASFLYF